MHGHSHGNEPCHGHSHANPKMPPAVFPTVNRNCAKCKRQPKEGEEFFRCAKCRSMLYCGAECQRADWKEHKRACEGLMHQYAMGLNMEAAKNMEVVQVLEGQFVDIFRTREPDGSVYRQHKLKREGMLESGCWCSDWPDLQTDKASVVLLTAPAEKFFKLRSLTVLDSIRPSEHARQHAFIHSPEFAVSLPMIGATRFSLNLFVLDGQLVSRLVEVAGVDRDLRTIQGTSVRTTMLMVSGSDADSLVSPPHTKGDPRNRPEHSNFHVWSRVGESVALPEIPVRQLPTFSRSSLSDSTRFDTRGALNLPTAGDTQMVGLLLIQEPCGVIMSAVDYEAVSLLGIMHPLHVPEPKTLEPQFVAAIRRGGVAGLAKRLSHPIKVLSL